MKFGSLVHWIAKSQLLHWHTLWVNVSRPRAAFSTFLRHAVGQKTDKIYVTHKHCCLWHINSKLFYIEILEFDVSIDWLHLHDNFCRWIARLEHFHILLMAKRFFVVPRLDPLNSKSNRHYRIMFFLQGIKGKLIRSG